MVGPDEDMQELTFSTPLPMTPAGEVALEDYARVLVGAEAAFAVRPTDEAPVVGVRIKTRSKVPAVQGHDIEAFARGLAAESGASGLGWS